jgi:DHA2 family multidrug resistance protein-like MFS transporter
LGLTKKQVVTVAVLLCGTLLAVLNQTLLSPALPVIMTDFGISATTVQWLTSGYSLVEAIIIPLSAYLLGRFSTRKLFIGGLGIFICGSLLSSLASNFTLLLLGRVLQAICTGMIMPMVMTIILLIFPREKRGAAMGLVALVIGFAPAIGPVLSGVLIDSIGWHALFVIVTVVAVIVMVLALVVLENYGNFHRITFDKISVALSSLGLVALLYGLSSCTSSENLALPICLIAIGIALVALFVRRQLHLDMPMLEVGVLKTSRYRTAVATVAIMQAALIGGNVIMPLFIQNACGYSATMSGLAMMPGAILGAILGLIAGRLFDRFGVRIITIIGAFVMVCGTAGLSLLQADASFIAITIAFTLLSAGLQFVMTPLNTWGINSLDNSVIQHANSLSNTLNQVAGSFGTALIVSLSALSTSLIPNASVVEQAYLGDHIAFIAMFALMVIVLLIVALLVREKKERYNGTPMAKTVSPSKFTSVPDFPTVVDVMNQKPQYVGAEANVSEALHALMETGTSGLPIVDADGSVVGFISDGDIMKYLGMGNVAKVDTVYYLYQVLDDENGKDKIEALLKLDVMKIATKRVVSLTEDAPLEDACKLLSERRIKKVPVIEDSRLVGSLSRRDIVRAIIE